MASAFTTFESPGSVANLEQDLHIIDQILAEAFVHSQFDIIHMQGSVPLCSRMYSHF